MSGQAANQPIAGESGLGHDLIRQRGFLRVLKEDFATHQKQITAPAFWALLVYRWGTWAETFNFKPFRWFLLIFYVLGQRFVRNFFGIELERTVAVGRRLKLGHQHGIVIHKFAKIGDDVLIRHSVTFGRGTEWEDGVGPIIGNRVEFSPGSVVIGNVTIGDDVSVGPNCVVSQNVPAGRSLFVPPPRSFPKADYVAEMKSDEPEQPNSPNSNASVTG